MNGDIPSGFIINLHKYFNRPADLFDQATEYYTNLAEKETQIFLLFGNFDRLSFYPVQRFREYRQKASQGYKWIGNRQSIMLYALDSDPNCSSGDDYRFGFQIDGDRTINHFGMVDQSGCFSDFQQDYLIVSLFYLSGKAKASVKEYSSFLQYCKNAFLAVTDAYNRGKEEQDRIHSEVFGTFSSAEIAVLWTANNYADVLYLVDNLRFLELIGYSDSEQKLRRVFISSHTFVSLTREGEKGFGSKKSGGALINLAGRFSASCSDPKKTGFQAIEDYVKHMLDSVPGVSDAAAPTMFSAGEYDLMLPVRPGLLPNVFNAASTFESVPSEEAYTLDVHNKAYSRTFFSSSTRLFYTQDDVKDLQERMQNAFRRKECGGEGLLFLEIPTDSQSHDYDLDNLNIFERIKAAKSGTEQGKGKNAGENIRSLFDRLRKEIASLVPESSDILSTMDLIFSDYIQCGTSTVDHLWVNDFDVQFATVLKTLNDCITDMKERDGPQDSRLTPNEYLRIVQKMFTVLQQQIYHIMDSSNLVFEEPRSHFSYTGQYDLLMHTYYGIAKCLIERLYKPDRPQSRLTPVINFASVSTIKSNLFIESAAEGDPDRLLEIRLPFEALYSLDHYVPMLIHELYHYAAPLDRGRRNSFFGAVLLTIFHAGLLRKALKKIGETLQKKTVADSPEADSPKVDSSEEWADKQTIQNAADLLVSFGMPVILKFFGKDTLEASVGRGDRKNVFVDDLRSLFLNKDNLKKTDYLSDLANKLHEVLSRCIQEKAWDDFLEKQNDVNRKAISDLADQCIDVLNYFAIGDYKKDLTIEDYKKDQKRVYVIQFQSILKECDDDYFKPALEQMNELFPDVAMITLGKMDLAAYLLHFVLFQNSEARKPEEVHSQTDLRIGWILEWLFDAEDKSAPRSAPETSKGKLDRLEAHRERFASLYQATAQMPGGTDSVSADDWFKYFKEAYERYLLTYSPCTTPILDMIEKVYRPCLEDCEHTEGIKKLQALCAEYYSILENCEKEQSKLTSKLFDHTINLIHSFQLQEKLKNMKGPQPPAPCMGEITPPYIWKNPRILFTSSRRDLVRMLSDDGQLADQLNDMVQQLRNYHSKVFGDSILCSIWFRGCRDAAFGVIPSIMVQFLEKKKLTAAFDGRNHIGTLMDYQRYRMEEFRFRADGAPELMNNSRYLDVDYLALMQHYRQPTGLLDWSEDAFSSLYFTLEKYIDGEDETEKSAEHPAALYFLDPMLYNRARAMMMRQVFLFCTKKLLDQQRNSLFCKNCRVRAAGRFQKYLGTVEKRPESIPNISIPENHDRYALLFSEDGVSDKQLYHLLSCRSREATLEEPGLKKELLHLPVAVYTARLNPRIRAQSGMFLAYNLNARPTWSAEDAKHLDDTCKTDKTEGTDLFHYLELETIQEYFLKTFPDERPFLLKLEIDAKIKKRLGIELRRLGLNRYRIYPELEHLKQK